MRGSGRDKPAVVADRYKYANFSSRTSLHLCVGESQTWRCILHILFSLVKRVLQRGCQFLKGLYC
ncbi:hypothetical protein [Enterobacter hormaechei]|nr:hypothetical protein [Enterobacter hormaechei]